MVGLTVPSVIKLFTRNRVSTLRSKLKWLDQSADCICAEWNSRLADAPVDVDDPEWTPWLDQWRVVRKTLKEMQLQQTRLHEKLEGVADKIDARIAQKYSAAWEAKHSNIVGMRPAIREVQASLTRKMLRTHYLIRRNEELATVLAGRLVCWNRRLSQSEGVGRGLDSRIVEIPLAFELCDFTRPGRILDAGCALNEPFIHSQIGSPIAPITHFTLSGEKESPHMDGAKFSYAFGDLREMPFRDGWFDRIVCVSTLEHVGMDNTRYDSSRDAETCPETYLDALKEMYRVLSPGGEMLVTFPYGAKFNHGWYQVFDQSAVQKMIDLADVGEAKYYYLGEKAWFEDGCVPPTLSASAECPEEPVACIRLKKRAQ